MFGIFFFFVMKIIYFIVVYFFFKYRVVFCWYRYLLGIKLKGLGVRGEGVIVLEFCKDDEDEGFEQYLFNCVVSDMIFVY